MQTRLLIGALALAVLVPGALLARPAPLPADTRTLSSSVPPWIAHADRGAPVTTDTLSFSVLLDPARTDATADVATWLRGEGLRVGELRGSVAVLPVSGTADRVGDAFGTSFATWSTAGVTAVAPVGALTVPRALGAVVGVAGVVAADTMRPTVAAPPPGPGGTDPRPPTLADDGQCAAYWGERLTDDWPASVDVTHRSNALCGYQPQQLREVHHVPAEYTGEGARIAIVAAYDDPDVEANTNTYFRAAGAQPFRAGQYEHHAPTSPDVDRCGGPQSWTEEQHLDVQAVHAMAPDASVAYWGADDCSSTALFSRILDVVEDDRADVISLSFGSTEDLDTADDRELLGRVLVEAASRDISVFASSGNDGDHSDFGDHDEGTDVTSPASSPYVTAVGATSTGLAADGSVAVEAGWETETRFARNGALIPPGFAYGAGGGESDVYDRPTWQRELLDEPGTGRLVPDVASIGDPNTGFVVYGPHSGETVYATHGGTSLATPMVASMVALAKAATGVEIGLATPALYDLLGTDALRDVTPASAATWSPKGPDAGALWPETVFVWDTKPQSLQSAPGWDDVTGVGVPDGRAFIEGFGKESDR
ncbi:S53 family peptidase [Curtobacterium sp. MCSS17_015]|uniref:S53 family peptidase n=1 Tax=Curtobacterium sp. MCSS17_015 TaxID=2175666 RepID=UPI000DAA7334|nr:S53 family peptidase [Curtobacterium sp. MCSS17_015]WIB26587.1 S53 family peptidase [Curtobacterium sp. MCSS17_015]